MEAVHLTGMLGALPFRVFVNPRSGSAWVGPLSETGFRRAKADITSWRDYRPTPLRELSAITAGAGVACIRLKDEADRFGLGSFKALGGAYAVASVVADELARRVVAQDVR